MKLTVNGKTPRSHPSRTKSLGLSYNAPVAWNSLLAIVRIRLNSSSKLICLLYVFDDCLSVFSRPFLAGDLSYGGNLAVPATRTLRYGPRSFAVAGPSTWNSLPAPLRCCCLTSTFRHDL